MKEVIFDTSIWIEYFKGNSEYFEPCQQLLDSGSVSTLEVIFAELMQGAKGKRELETIELFYKNLPKLDAPNQIFEAGIFSQKNQLLSKGIGLIDSIIIFAAIQNQKKIWTLDKKINAFLASTSF
ncbi:MAG: PIN domain-containing protein [Algoriphagus sp.]|uniref:PIN domain-containing protein n=1 Tax=Algoriphagus sp. TaxID=1872435 RepID=UPI0027300F2D|nr:PIN domain-containing protein [Algoriphagus sp.]MDP2043042.1 PIN domain-containing protein [Algoriphagus sp.]MDP3473749.1 PIN domain-containing protein [Algoriphagus sp.]